MGGWLLVWLVVAGCGLRAGERDLVRLWMGSGLCWSGVWAALVGLSGVVLQGRCERREGLRAGSLTFQRRVSPRFVGRVLVRRVPRSVELH